MDFRHNRIGSNRTLNMDFPELPVAASTVLLYNRIDSIRILYMDCFDLQAAASMAIHSLTGTNYMDCREIRIDSMLDFLLWHYH
ncbi:hypothetical protein GCM10027286_08060 [Virgibacillus ainsalahensis]